MADPSHSNPVCNFFRKSSSNTKNIRKRTARFDDDEDADQHQQQQDDDDDAKSTSLQRKAPKTADNKLHFSTTTASSRRSTAAAAASDNSNATPIFEFESSKEIQVQHDSRATATLETETEFSRDARAIRERVLKQAEEALTGKGKAAAAAAKSSSGAGAGHEKIYKGIHGYTDYKAGFRREQTVAGEKAGGAHGPLRASAHIRVSARFDYQPDICKDYKETGYCGFGDACKFMHDRGDYKSGWQLEREWEESEKQRKRNLAMGGGDDNDDDEDGVLEHNHSDDDDDDELPFACFICRQPFVDPVVTKCKHYFCEHCALKHHSKNKKCFVCNQPTLGIFNTAHEIKKKMAERK